MVFTYNPTRKIVNYIKPINMINKQNKIIIILDVPNIPTADYFSVLYINLILHLKIVDCSIRSLVYCTKYKMRNKAAYILFVEDLRL